MAARNALLVDERPNVDQPLAHRDIPLDHPIERPAVENIVAALGHHARRVLELGLLPALLERRQTLLLPIAQILDGIAADAEFDQMKCQRRDPYSSNLTMIAPSLT